MHLVNYLKIADEKHSLVEYTGNETIYYNGKTLKKGKFIIIHNDYLPHVNTSFEIKYKH